MGIYFFIFDVLFAPSTLVFSFFRLGKFSMILLKMLAFGLGFFFSLILIIHRFDLFIVPPDLLDTLCLDFLDLTFLKPSGDGACL